MTDARDHLPELDRLKGFAIACVVCIHAELYSHTLFFDRIVNRAVPIFIVLFGVTSELWWKRAQAMAAERGPVARWYRTRFQRLIVPFWTLGAAWWIAVLASNSAERLRLDWRHAIATPFGYAPWIGTSWFVTVILQLVLFYPVLRWFVNRVGTVVSLLLLAAACAFAVYNFLSFVSAGLRVIGTDFVGPGWFYFWIFSPRLFWHVAAGLALARHFGGRVGPIMTAVAVALAVLGSVLQELVRVEGDFFSPIREQLVAYLFDVPLAIGLLGLFRLVPLPAPLGRALAWCGLSSWGIYLGHLFVYELVHLAGYAPETGPQAQRALYAAGLLASGAAIAAALDWFMRRVKAPLVARAARG